MPVRRQRQGAEVAHPPLDLAEYQARHGSSVEFLRRRLKTTRYRVYGLLDPLRKPLTLDADLLTSLSALLGRPACDIEAYYSALIARRIVEFQQRKGKAA